MCEAILDNIKYVSVCMCVYVYACVRMHVCE